MKDRSVKAGVYEVAELYYNQQATHHIDWISKNGDRRPNDY